MQRCAKAETEAMRVYDLEREARMMRAALDAIKANLAQRNGKALTALIAFEDCETAKAEKADIGRGR